ncbi:MAG: SpoIIE family protein phosphatase [Sulfuricella sp.]|nr:SpoIIE family protein phosphatase [Sulfuricella sp.]
MAKIVVIEDEEAIRNNLAMLLRIEGHEVRMASDGEAGLALVRAEQPDLVLCDIMMPRLDGHGVLKALQAEPATAGISFVFLTARADKSDFRSGMALGADDYLTKPFTREDVLQTVAARLHKSQARRRETAALEHSREQLRHEIDQAQRLVANFVDPGVADIPHLACLMRPREIAGGDLLLARRRANGNTVFLLGDATGHGLTAAIATLPVARVFDEGIARDANLAELLGLVNRVLKRLLPAGMFLAAVLIESHPEAHRFTLWNGGMPAIQLFGPDGTHLGEAPSRNLPLGVVEDAEWHFEHLDLPPASRAYACSDGIPESHGAGGEMFGMARLRDSIAAFFHQEDRMARIDEAIAGYLGNQPQHDDIALAELALN